MKFVDPLQGVSDLIKVSLDGRCRALALIVFEGWRSRANEFVDARMQPTKLI